MNPWPRHRDRAFSLEIRSPGSIEVRAIHAASEERAVAFAELVGRAYSNDTTIIVHDDAGTYAEHARRLSELI